MWIFKYNDIPSGEAEPVVYSSLISPIKESTVGRKKATYSLKSPKVSHNHLKLKVQRGHDSTAPSKLLVWITGRNTIIGGEVIKRGNLPESAQSMEFMRELDRTTPISLGTNGMDVEVCRKYILIKLSENSDVDLKKLDNLDINYSYQFLKYTSHLICPDMTFHGATLTALLSGISIVRPSFIDALNENALFEDFELNFPKIEDHLPAPSAIIRHERKTMFENTIFVFGDANQATKLGSRLEIGHAQYCAFDFVESSTKQDFLNFINGLPQEKNIILVKIEEYDENDFSKSIYDPNHNRYPFLLIMDEAATELGKYVVTTHDIFNAIKDVDLQYLLRKRIPKTSPTLSSEPEPAQKKQKTKARRRPQIKALDSLDFFAGGGKYESSQAQPSTQISDTSQQQVQETPPVEEETAPKLKKQRKSRIESLPNQMLDTNYKPSLDTAEENVANEAAEVQIPESDSNGPEDLTKVQHRVPESSQEGPDEGSRIESAEVKNEGPIKDETQTSFQTAIKNAKQSAKERINTQLGLVDDDLSPEDIAQLKNLAIVEYVDFPFRSQKPTTQVENNPQWAGRKNFKTFVKNTSKSQKAKKDPSFLYTRTYVPLKTVDPRKAVDKHGQFNLPEHVQEEEQQRQKKGDMEVFHEDEEEEDGYDYGDHNTGTTQSFAFRNDLRQPTMVDKESTTKNKSNLFVFDSDDEDADDGLDMPVRKDDVEMIPEYKRDKVHEPKESVKQKNAIEHQIPIEIDEESDLEYTLPRTNASAKMERFKPRHDSDDDDDENGDDNNDKDDDDDDDHDDDTPKFRFRR